MGSNLTAAHRGLAAEAVSVKQTRNRQAPAQALPGDSSKPADASPLILPDVTFDFVLPVLMRFIHIGSVILFLGGVVYARQVLGPLFASLPETFRESSANAARMRYRSTLFTLLCLIVLSGLYNLLVAAPKHTGAWQMWFGVKMLLVLHILTAAILWATKPYAAGKSDRRLLGIVISGFLVVLISAYLRWLTQHGL
ncbi:MAG TPA: hypothetical protein VH325_09735 [Bryobacteraceae bacterium]|nr:hypothetical protein [Bryobacteraceae bacterium]